MNDCEKFFDFCEKKVKLENLKGEDTPFKLFDYQKRLIETCYNNQFVIGSKFRVGGFTTTMSTWLYWNCLNTPNTNALFVGFNDRTCQWANEILIRGDSIRANGHLIEFNNGSKLMFRTPIACCGCSADYCYIDEAAYMQDMDAHWKALYPVFKDAKNVTVLSTRSNHRKDEWFEKTLKEAMVKSLTFKHFSCSYKEHPLYAREEWEQETKKNLGKYFRLEMDQLTGGLDEPIS